MTAPDWYAATFGECPHGYVKPYCALCVGDQLEAERFAKAEAKRLREASAREAAGMRQTVARQSDAIDSLQATNRQLRAVIENLRRARP